MNMIHRRELEREDEKKTENISSSSTSTLEPRLNYSSFYFFFSHAIGPAAVLLVGPTSDPTLLPILIGATLVETTDNKIFSWFGYTEKLRFSP